MDYITDTKKFWQERRQFRIALDKKRANVSENKRILEQIYSDIRFLKTGVIVDILHGNVYSEYV